MWKSRDTAPVFCLEFESYVRVESVGGLCMKDGKYQRFQAGSRVFTVCCVEFLFGVFVYSTNFH